MLAFLHHGRFRIVAIVLAARLFAVASGNISQYEGSRHSSTVPFENGEKCTTPNGEEGICKNLKSCRYLLKLLIDNKSKSNSRVFEFLRRSHCGFDGLDPIVCCSVERNEPKKSQGRISSSKKTLPKGYNDELCGFVVQSGNKVFGGTATGPNEFPWMALIGYKTKYGLQHRCGGSLISSRYVLTAAHCVSHLKEISPISIRLGESYSSAGKNCWKRSRCYPSPLDVSIEKITPHPDYYKPELRNDIALIKLAREIKMTDSIRPVCIPENPNETMLTKSQAIVTGWGTTEKGTKSQTLLKASLPIVPRSECARIYGRKIPITESQICAGGVAGKDSCSGDSGGPLQVLGLNSAGEPAYYQIGIVSFGSVKCGAEGVPGVYTKVSHYVDWILKNMEED